MIVIKSMSLKPDFTMCVYNRSLIYSHRGKSLGTSGLKITLHLIKSTSINYWNCRSCFNTAEIHAVEILAHGSQGRVLADIHCHVCWTRVHRKSPEIGSKILWCFSNTLTLALNESNYLCCMDVEVKAKSNAAGCIRITWFIKVSGFCMTYPHNNTLKLRLFTVCRLPRRRISSDSYRFYSQRAPIIIAVASFHCPGPFASQSVLLVGALKSCWGITRMIGWGPACRTEYH